jgi:hypothetical protein
VPASEHAEHADENDEEDSGRARHPLNVHSCELIGKGTWSPMWAFTGYTLSASANRPCARRLKPCLPITDGRLLCETHAREQIGQLCLGSPAGGWCRICGQGGAGPGSPGSALPSTDAATMAAPTGA